MSALSLSGPQTLFQCEGARLVKHIPSSPSRVNGAAPRDPLGVYGRKNARDTVIADWNGTLYLDNVQDPFNEAIRTLVISIDLSTSAAAAAHFGAARRCVLPFRSYDQGALTDGSRPQLTAQRQVYLGLSSGLSGANDASFWFYEDVGEQGGMERAQLESQGKGRRAVWTCFIPGDYVQTHNLKSLLVDYPNHQLMDAAPTTSRLPTRENDERLVEVRKSLFLDHWTPDEIANVPVQQPAQTDEEENAAVDSPSEEVLNFETIDATPTKLRRAGGEVDSETSQQAHETSAVSEEVVDDAEIVAKNLPGSSTLRRNSTLSRQENASGTGSVLRNPTLRARLNESRLSSFRNSLIAVDNETGEVIGVFAQDIHLPQTYDPNAQEESSSDEGEHEALTPGQDESPEELKGLSREPSVTESIIRPASKYLDFDDERIRPSSRTGSVLGEDTFAPPPIPFKFRDVSRDSQTSAAFYTAAETASEMSDAESEADSGGHVRLSLHSQHGIEPHKPELLRDTGNESDGADSDASGSTIGGPAVKLWRRARGKKPKRKGSGKKGEPDAQEEAETTEPTANADADTEAEMPLPEAAPLSEVHQNSPKAVEEDLKEEEEVSEEAAEDVLGPMPTTTVKNLTVKTRRELLRTDEVRSAEDDVWSHAITSGELPADAAYTHLHASPVKGEAAKAPAAVVPKGKAPVQGGTVLLEFLSDSKIGATLISNDESPEQDASSTLSKSLIPVLPVHLLWFLGIANASNVSAAQRQSLSAVSLPSFESIRQATVSLPEVLATSATAGSNALISSSRDLWTGITSAASSLFGSSETKEAPVVAPRDYHDNDDEDEGSYVIPPYNADSWGATPRPVFRRRKPTPSFVNGYNIDDASKYTILHVDNYARPRDVFMY